MNGLHMTAEDWEELLQGIILSVHAVVSGFLQKQITKKKIIKYGLILIPGRTTMCEQYLSRSKGSRHASLMRKDRSVSMEMILIIGRRVPKNLPPLVDTSAKSNS